MEYGHTSGKMEKQAIARKMAHTGLSGTVELGHWLLLSSYTF